MMAFFWGVELAVANSSVISQWGKLRSSLRTAAPRNHLRRSGFLLIRLPTGAGNVSMLF